jgi:hypothetical protein
MRWSRSGRRGLLIFAILIIKFEFKNFDLNIKYYDLKFFKLIKWNMNSKIDSDLGFGIANGQKPTA